MATRTAYARLAATVSIVALTVAAPALAQTSTASQPVTAVDDIIVTAQKREESIQDVPIAVSAFSAETLDAMKIEGGSELVRAVPNVAFSKNNFSMYNFSIRGIGTKAISSSSDPAVAVSFNNTPLTRNRLFEQEYLDVNRVEVLRGPQGTLYGRNATGGVVNMIPNLPGPDFDAMLKVEAGNYGTQRGQMMINVPLSDTFWVRGAASTTKREGFDRNTFLDTRINDRDLWSTRLSAAWQPNDRFSANLIWEHFEEDDQRSRTGKQLCTKDPGPSRVGSTDVPSTFLQNRLSQGCLPRTLFSDAAYDTPNGGAFGHVFFAGSIQFGNDADGNMKTVDYRRDPYEGVVQSRNLREIASAYDPKFRAKNDLFQLNLEYNLTDNITFYSQTAFAKDSYWSTQDYNRYVSNPIFPDTTSPTFDYIGNPYPLSPEITPGGVYTDPQLGASTRMLSADLSASENEQFVQEFRLQSNFEKGFNFSIGANYIDFKTEDNYYVFNNLFTYIAEYSYNNVPGLNPYTEGWRTQVCDENATDWKECIYVDPTPISNLAGDGHNYFRSRNVVGVRSWAVFGEGYWDVTDNVRVTAGLRYTDDEKTTTPYPSQLLLGALPDGSEGGVASGGYVSRGYPALPDVVQSWDAITGRLVVDWKPELSFTDDTLFYASYSRGYKGGGTNPPRVDINPAVVQYQPLAEDFAPEYVNAFEIGTKNSFKNGRVRLNANAFYYDYEDYQVSQIVDRISLNENFDARIWGVELESVFHVTDRFRIDANVGYLNTRVADGEGSIDVMNRTQGNSDWTVLRPWVQVPSNCVAPTELVERVLQAGYDDAFTMFGLQGLCAGSRRSGSFDPNFETFLPLYLLFGFEYDPLTAPNGGRGFMADLGGNEMPNSPNLTLNLGAQYVFTLNGWDMTVRGDYYWQDESYARIYNTEYDRLKAWDNLNLSVVIENAARDLVFTAYVKNVFDDAPITDMFTNSDDTGLTANVFTLDPRLVGFSLTKRF